MVEVYLHSDQRISVNVNDETKKTLTMNKSGSFHVKIIVDYILLIRRKRHVELSPTIKAIYTAVSRVYISRSRRIHRRPVCNQNPALILVPRSQIIPRASKKTFIIFIHRNSIATTKKKEETKSFIYRSADPARSQKAAQILTPPHRVEINIFPIPLCASLIYFV